MSLLAGASSQPSEPAPGKRANRRSVQPHLPHIPHAPHKSTLFHKIWAWKQILHLCSFLIYIKPNLARTLEFHTSTNNALSRVWWRSASPHGPMRHSLALHGWKRQLPAQNTLQTWIREIESRKLHLNHVTHAGDLRPRLIDHLPSCSFGEVFPGPTCSSKKHPRQKEIRKDYHPRIMDSYLTHSNHS